MAIDFPNSPSTNDEFTVGSKTWKWDGSAWRLVGGGVSLGIDDLLDVNTTGAESGEFLKYNGESWIPDAISTINSLDDIGDITAPTPTTGDYLKWDGTKWVNDAVELGIDTTGEYVSGVAAGTGVSVAHTPGEGSTATVSLNASLDNLSDVVVTSPLQFQGLMYDGTNWVNSNIPNTYLVRNNTGSTLLKGTLVGAVGAEPSGRIDVAPFEVTGGQDSELRAMGIVVSNISNGVNGEVMSFGTLTGLDTRGSTASALAVGDETWAAGDILFAHPTVDGKLTNVRPQHDLAVAFITVRHASSGQIAIRIIPGNNHLEWMHDVSLTTPATGDALTYNGSVWVNTPGMPSGSITQFAGASAPAGWLSCDGTTVSRTTYAALFAVIGTTYGAGDGSTTFTLPNMKGRVPVGYDSTQAEFDGLGETGGEKTHLLIVSEMPSHTHLQNAHNHTQNAHGHSISDPGHNHSVPANWGGAYNAVGVQLDPTTYANPYYYNTTTNNGTGISVNSNTATNIATTATNQNTGGDQAHNNLQPYIVLNYIIKA
jgi:microcystin-dependent protein